MSTHNQTWGQLLLNVMHYITNTFKIIALHYDYNYRGFDNVMHYITITSQSNALHYNYLKGFRTLFIYIPDKKRNAYSNFFPFSLPFLDQVI